VGWIAGLHGMEEWHSARLQARTALLFEAHFPPRAIRRLDGAPDVVERFAPILDRYGQLHPPLQTEASLDGFAADERPLPDYAARVHAVGFRGPRLHVDGHAWLPDAGRRADGVLFVVREPDGRARVVALGELRGLPWLPVAAHDHAFDGLRRPGLADRGAFSVRISGARLPARDRFELEVWAVDALHMRVRPFAERLLVERGADGRQVRRVFPTQRKAP
jgi:hypothetical protein